MMSDRGDGSRAGSDAAREPAMSSRRGLVWMTAAFAFLIAGLLGGTILFAWKQQWAWVAPLAAFGGYILAFRHGLRLWNPNVDRTWRRYLWLEHGMAGEDGRPPGQAEDRFRGAPNPRIACPDEPRPPRHEMRVIR
jgi:hypothetical protein